jgi:imidazolonepropionase-like amidohydrolase
MILLAACLGATGAFAQAIAFTDVSVIPMDRERVLERQTVVVRDGRIAELGDAAKVRIPEGALRISGAGKFLIPGLLDMHTHLFSDNGGLPKEMGPEELKVMVAYGVTGARLMIGTPEHLRYRSQVARGEILGPALWVASPEVSGLGNTPPLNGRLVKTAEEARAAVRDYKDAGYDFIKITEAVVQPACDAVYDEAKKQAIPVVGHVDPSVGANYAIEKGQQIEHLDAYLEAILSDDSPVKRSVSSRGLFQKENWTSLDHIDPAKLRAIAEKTAKAGIYSTPTLTFFKFIYGLQTPEEELRKWPDFRYMPPKSAAAWLSALPRIYARIQASEKHRKKYIETRFELTRRIHEAGGKIMAGSDSPELFIAYGLAIHRELECLVEAGLSPFSALAAATRVPAEFLKGEGEFGTIKKGLRADMVLLEANPLEIISNTRKIAGVMVAGTWIAGKECERMLDSAAEKIAKAGA